MHIHMLSGRTSCYTSIRTLANTLTLDFAISVVSGCKCMTSESVQGDWDCARFMPSLNHELMKAIVAVRFDRESFERLVVLRARARLLGW